MLTFGSLFAGIGGFDLGLERAGMRCLWQCEIDPYAQRVLAKHWPDVLRVRDVRDVGADTVPTVDLVCGGFPCQGVSFAGLGLGLADERSGLWSEMLRVIRELRPRWVVVENVAALLSRGLDVVLGGLAACGYDAEWDCISASAVGAPHQRDRIWLVAYPAVSGRREGRPGRSADGGARQPEPVGAFQDADANGRRLEVCAQLDGEEAQDPADGNPRWRHVDGLRDEVADADNAGLEGHGRSVLRPGEQSAPAASPSQRSLDGHAGHWSVEPDVGRVAHGVPARVDRLRSLGNALVPQIAEWIGRRIIDYEEGRVSDAV